MKCKYCNIDIHPANLIYIENKPYHCICVELINQKTKKEKAPILIQYLVFGILIIIGLIGNYFIFKLGIYLAKLLTGR